jgi:hypothetical protein
MRLKLVLYNSRIAFRTMFAASFCHLILLIKSIVKKTDFKKAVLAKPNRNSG